MQRTPTRRLTVVGYALLADAAFLAASAWAATFVADLQLPRGIDHETQAPGALAVVVDVALLLVFALQHSIMARRGFKGWVAAGFQRTPSAARTCSRRVSFCLCCSGGGNP